MIPEAILLPIAIPAIFGLACFLVPDGAKRVKESIALLATGANLTVAILLFGKGARLEYPWAPEWGIDFSFRLYRFSGFIVLAAALFGLAIALYSWSFMKGKGKLRQYYAYVLLTLAQVNGAVLADNLAVMLIFWESLLLTLYGMIAIGHDGSHGRDDGRGANALGESGRGAAKTAAKAFTIAGVTDLCMMLGVIILWKLAGTLSMSSLRVGGEGLGALAFVLLMIGAVSKAGSMPFHSWIPDAALDAPLTFMAFVPAALEKLLGIYFLSRIVLDFYALKPDSWLSLLLMIVGVATIILAVMMALIQKDYKKLLSFHAISQVGYMILGIGTCVPAGMIGGIFHMINHAIYKSGLFLSGGAVERQTGTTDLNKLGGLAKSMPVTFACFLVTAASISGAPPFNGFFSKELVYDGALERGWIFYALAALGSFLTAASFLKLGHAAYFGEPKSAGASGKAPVKEAPLGMLLPMLAIAFFCVFFGLCNPLPIDSIIAPTVAAGAIDSEASVAGAFSGWPHSAFLVSMTLGILLLAIANHAYGARRSGSGLGAADHIHYAPGLRGIYEAAEKGILDPYNIGMRIATLFAGLCALIDRGIDWFYEKAVVKAVGLVSTGIRGIHSGNYSRYILWSLAGILALFAWMFSQGLRP
jgi:formate hydrogenlyase subunit 3/multisubunit Na+/H+ antiporter MnhD subunit